METKTTIPLPLYDYRIYVIFTDDLEKSANNLAAQGKLVKNHGIDDTTDGFHVRMPNQSYCYIVLKYNATPSHITHEAYHCVVNLFKWISASQEEELFAYHLGYVVGLIHKDQEKAKKVLDKQKNL